MWIRISARALHGKVFAERKFLEPSGGFEDVVLEVAQEADSSPGTQNRVIGAPGRSDLAHLIRR